MTARIRLLGIVASACLAASAPWPAAAGRAGGAETGQDFTKPLARVDLRLKYGKIDEQSHSTVATARLDGSVALGGEWQLALRADLPYAWSDASSADNPGGAARRGVADATVEALVIAPVGGRWAYGYGARVVLPTASEDSLGTGKYQFVPTVGARYDLGSWATGAWCAVLARHAFDVASRGEGRPYVSQTYLQPLVNLMLPRLWFLTFAPEARYDWRVERWFVPFDLMVGKLVTANLVVSLEYKNAIVDDLPLFSQEVEARVGFLF